MKTGVIMERELLGSVVRQRSDSEMLSASDMVKVGNKYRIMNDLPPFNLTAWLNNKSTKEFSEELSKKFGKILLKSKTGIWVHPYLFISLAIDINPTFKVEVIGWLYDLLIKTRKDSGDSYKKMCGNLYVRQGNKRDFPVKISEIASKIKIACNVKNWETADEKQLLTRDKIHNNIALLSNVLKDVDKAVELGIKETLGLRG